MINDLNVIFGKNNLELVIQIVKTIIIALCTYYTNFKIVNKKFELNFLGLVGIFIVTFLAILSTHLRLKINFLVANVFLVIFISMIFSLYKVKNSVTVTVMSIVINYSIFIFSIIIDFVINKIVFIDNDCIDLIIILMVYFIVLARFNKIKKFKYGIYFLKESTTSQYMDILVLSIGITVLSSLVILGSDDIVLAMSITPIIMIDVIALIITIIKVFEIYYKQKLLIQELEETKVESTNRGNEIQKLEKENLNFGKKSHTLSHKQKLLEYKLNQLAMKTEIADEISIREDLKDISKELYNNSAIVELTKTGIEKIDDMLKYMQFRCIENNIDFNLQIIGNIYHMINNIVTKEELEILIADHVEDAIIAINHTDNINRSILVKLGKIEECYGLYIYDSGIEFEKETLKNLGKKPITTHASEGGTGMGFMNSFDTLKRNKASLVIKELGKPSQENYTKIIMFKFDNKNEFKVI